MEDLIPEEVASTLGISYSYLRKLLSKDMDTTFSAVLNNLRITRVKELLISTQLSNRDIARLVGFGSEQTFYRIFRQQEGCSPGEWRRTAAIPLNSIENDN